MYSQATTSQTSHKLTYIHTHTQTEILYTYLNIGKHEKIIHDTHILRLQPHKHPDYTHVHMHIYTYTHTYMHAYIHTSKHGNT